MCLLILKGAAQDLYRVYGSVKDSQGIAVANATVTLKSFLDSSILFVQTDTLGKFRIRNVRFSQFNLEISNVGYKAYHSD
jgi:hypothetical protein